MNINLQFKIIIKKKIHRASKHLRMPWTNLKLLNLTN